MSARKFRPDRAELLMFRRVLQSDNESASDAVEKLRNEGISALEDGINCGISYVNLRTPRGYCSSKTQAFKGIVVVTHERLVIHNYFRRLLDAAGDQLTQVLIARKGERLSVSFDAGMLDSSYSGRIEIALKSRDPARLHEKLMGIQEPASKQD